MMPCVVKFIIYLLYKRLPMCVYNSVLALHIDTTALSDGTYELIPESDGGDLEAQVNTAEQLKPRTKVRKSLELK